MARFARHSLRGGSRGNFCVGARIVATATAWVHMGSVQLANTTNKVPQKNFSFPTSNRLHLTSFVKTSAWGGVWYGMVVSGIRDAPCRSIPTHSCDLRQGRGSDAILRPATWVHIYHNIRQHSHADKPQAYAIIVIGSKLPQSHTAYPVSLTLTCVAAYLATWTCASLPRGRKRRKAGVRRNRPTENPSPDAYHLPLSRQTSRNKKASM